MGAGQLGNGTTTGSPTPVEVIGLTNATNIGSGTFHTCVATSEGTVECWGDNAGGQIGTGIAGDPVTSPVTVSGIG